MSLILENNTGSIKLLILPLGYLLIKIGYTPSLIFVGYAVLEAVSGLLRVVILKKTVGLDVNYYFKQVFAYCFKPVLITFFYMYAAVNLLSFHLRFIFTISSGASLFLILIYYFGMNEKEKEFSIKYKNNFLKKLKVHKWNHQNIKDPS